MAVPVFGFFDVQFQEGCGGFFIHLLFVHTMVKGPAHEVLFVGLGPKQAWQGQASSSPEECDISNGFHLHCITAMPLTNRLTSKSSSSEGEAVGRCCCKPWVKDTS